MCGFLEGVTWTHVVMRDFRRKQVFIRHDEFAKLTLQNWSRRPSKQCYFLIPINPGLSGGGDRAAKLVRLLSSTYIFVSFVVCPILDEEE